MTDNPIPFRKTERVVELDAAIEEFATELAPLLREARQLKVRELGRVLAAFLKAPVIDLKPGDLQSAKEHKLFVGMLMLTDKKLQLLDAIEARQAADASPSDES